MLQSTDVLRALHCPETTNLTDLKTPIILHMHLTVKRNPFVRYESNNYNEPTAKTIFAYYYNTKY